MENFSLGANSGIFIITALVFAIFLLEKKITNKNSFFTASLLILWALIIVLPSIPVLIAPITLPIEGIVVDEETGKPLENILVKVGWQSGVATMGGGHSSTYKSLVRKTDNNGKFSVPITMKALNVQVLPFFISYYGGVSIAAFGSDHKLKQMNPSETKQLLKRKGFKRHMTINLAPINNELEYLKNILDSDWASCHMLNENDLYEHGYDLRCHEEEKALFAKTFNDFKSKYPNANYQNIEDVDFKSLSNTFESLKLYDEAIKVDQMVLEEYPSHSNNYHFAEYNLQQFMRNGKIDIERALDMNKIIRARSVYNDQIPIFITPNKNLQGLEKEKVITIRKKRVKYYESLNIYPHNYEPSTEIFGDIKSGAEWIADTQFFVSNPYLLVLTSAANYVNALLPYCGPSIKYTSNSIKVEYKDWASNRWFQYIFHHYPDSKGFVRLWLVNALDAGFKYANIDMSRSKNIDPNWFTTEASVMRNIYSPKDTFHLGSKGKNNISPTDPNARIRLLKKNEMTVIYVKLWKNKPLNKEVKEDFSYIIDVVPFKN